MSYDIRLEIDTGGPHPAAVTEYRNPTYNLAEMFAAALRTKSIRDLEGKTGAETAQQLREAVDDMRARPEHFEQFNPPNGWGDYDGAVETLEWMLGAALSHPKATWRI